MLVPVCGWLNSDFFNVPLVLRTPQPSASLRPAHTAPPATSETTSSQPVVFPSQEDSGLWRRSTPATQTFPQQTERMHWSTKHHSCTHPTVGALGVSFTLSLSRKSLATFPLPAALPWCHWPQGSQPSSNCSDPAALPDSINLHSTPLLRHARVASSGSPASSGSSTMVASLGSPRANGSPTDPKSLPKTHLSSRSTQRTNTSLYAAPSANLGSCDMSLQPECTAKELIPPQIKDSPESSSFADHPPRRCAQFIHLQTPSTAPCTNVQAAAECRKYVHVRQASKQHHTAAPSLSCRLMRSRQARSSRRHHCVARCTENLPIQSPQTLGSTSQNLTKAALPAPCNPRWAAQTSSTWPPSPHWRLHSLLWQVHRRGRFRGVNDIRFGLRFRLFRRFCATWSPAQQPLPLGCAVLGQDHRVSLLIQSRVPKLQLLHLNVDDRPIRVGWSYVSQWMLHWLRTTNLV